MPEQPQTYPVPERGAWPKSSLTWKRYFFESAFRLMAWLAMARRSRMITWDLTWFPTYSCNLKCWYCFSIYGRADPPNPEKAIRRIIRMAPASLVILGGEPFVLRGFVDYVRKIRAALPKTYIVVSTNGMVRPELIEQIVPLIDSLCVSIDGEGEYQSGPRGGDSDTIISNMRKAHETRVRLRHTMDIVASAVVSRHNALHLPELFRRLARDIAPDILGMVQSLDDFNSEHSIASDPERVRAFLREMNRLKKEMRILILGRLGNDQTRDQAQHEIDESRTDDRLGLGPLVTCHQERFYAHLTPSGTVYTCRTYAGIDTIRRSVLEKLHAGRWFAAMWVGFRGFNQWVIKPSGFSCTEFRNCPEWAEDIMKAKSPAHAPIELHRVYGRLGRKNLRRSVEFIQRFVNPGFDPQLLHSSDGTFENAPHIE